MSHPVASREDWLKARLALLAEEKELTRRSDELAQRRQELPWVRVDKDYRFDTDRGPAVLKDLFDGRSQLLVYHFMFGPEFTAGCPSCSSLADEFDRISVHLANHDVTLMAVSRAPLEKLQAYKRRMGWSFPWASSIDGAFNHDFSASYTEEDQRAGLEYNYNSEPPMPESSGQDGCQGPLDQVASGCGVDVPAYIRERPGMSAFVLEDAVVYHTYSAYSRGLDVLWGKYQWLDRAPKGRNDTSIWIRRRDEYETQPAQTGACCHQTSPAVVSLS